MPMTQYSEVKIRKVGLDQIAEVNGIVEAYQAQGYTLTLRQVYYQMVARNIIENSERSYKNLGNLINNGRMAGLIDWEAIEDRTRYIRQHTHWDSPEQIMQAAVDSYHTNLWSDQPRYVEVWVEKDALIGIVEQAASGLDVPCFSCRGYVSASAMWAAAHRMRSDKECVILHLGDHDPSGIDMTRDIQERLSMFGATVDVRRIALNMEQIEEYTPPPNPAKETDTRASGYVARYGNYSWELDALEPSVLDLLIARHIKALMDIARFNQAIERREAGRQKIQRMITNEQ